MDYLLLGIGLVGILAVLWLAYLVHLLLDEVSSLKLAEAERAKRSDEREKRMGLLLEVAKAIYERDTSLRERLGCVDRPRTGREILRQRLAQKGGQ
jgi:hypothetical protein